VDDEDVHTPPEELSSEEFQRIYGPIQPLDPRGAAELFRGAPFRWWVAGGWSVELGPQPRREHEDLEVAVARDDLPAVRDWLRDYHLWDIHEGALLFLKPGSDPPNEEHEQLWLRRDAYSPWILDLLLTPVTGDTWFYKRDRRLTRPIESVIRRGADGVPYQQPEIGLLFKARRRAPRDEQDFAAIVPQLDDAARAWLTEAIAMTEPPGNPWLERL
jgi:hypothetical protein